MMLRTIALMIYWVMTLPAVALHEITHLAAAKPAAEHMTVRVSMSGTVWGVDWKPEVSRWQVVAAHLAPTIVGMAAGLLAVGLLVTDTVAGPDPIGYWLLLGGYWLIFTWPSREDRTIPDSDQLNGGT